jgi:hypothetical protein
MTRFQFEIMSHQELRAYVLQNCNDDEAFRLY